MKHVFRLTGCCIISASVRVVIWTSFPNPGPWLHFNRCYLYFTCRYNQADDQADLVVVLCQIAPQGLKFLLWQAKHTQGRNIRREDMHVKTKGQV